MGKGLGGLPLDLAASGPWFLLTLACALFTVWALWVRDPASLGLIAGFAVLARVARENRENGIDP